MKFSPSGGTINVNLEEGDGVMVVSVEDQGIGISEKELSSLFSFEDGKRKLGTAKEKGSGLGLILCKEFVEKNHGNIWVESQSEKGSKFSFTVPLLTEAAL